MEPSLSLALIVRDEAEHLAACLACFEALSPEICVVDTGSVDGTPEIAEACGARVRRVAWNNDFAAARNASLAMCTRPWIFVIDADERLALEDVAAFGALLSGPPARAYRYITRNYTANPNVSEFEPCMRDDAYAQGFVGWFPSVKVRLFPNDTQIRFEGVVHELVNPSLERLGIPIETSDISIHHYPLLRSEAARSRKAALYLELGRDKVRQRPDDPKAHVEMGNQYADMGDYAGAAACYRAALALEPGSAEVLKDLGAVLHLLERHAEAQKALELAVRLQPTLYEAWRNLGVVHAASGEWERAARCFECAMTLRPTWRDGHRFLSVALERAGRLDEAVAEAQTALEHLPESQAAAAHYVALMSAQGQDSAAREVLDALVAARPNARGWRFGREHLERPSPKGVGGH